MQYLAVVIATVVAFAVGVLWYGPLFGKHWRKMIGIEETAGKMPPVSVMAYSFVSTLVMVYVYAVLRNALGISAPGQAAWLAIILVIGFVATTMFSSVLYERRPAKLYLFNLAHYAVALAAAALVLAFLNW